MGTTTKQIEAHIEETRDALSTNLEELEQKVKAAADWRHHFRTRPKILLGIALGGGVALAAVFGGRINRGEKGLSYTPSAGAEPSEAARKEKVARQPWDEVKGAIIAVATASVLSYTAEVFLGIRRKSEPNETTGGIFSPSGRESHRPKLQARNASYDPIERAARRRTTRPSPCGGPVAGGPAQDGRSCALPKAQTSFSPSPPTDGRPS